MSLVIHSRFEPFMCNTKLKLITVLVNENCWKLLVIVAGWFPHAFCLQSEYEFGAFSYFGLNSNRASHFFDDLLADGEAKPCALSVPMRVLI